MARRAKTSQHRKPIDLESYLGLAVIVGDGLARDLLGRVTQRGR